MFHSSLSGSFLWGIAPLLLHSTSSIVTPSAHAVPTLCHNWFVRWGMTLVVHSILSSFIHSKLGKRKHRWFLGILEPLLFPLVAHFLPCQLIVSCTALLPAFAIIAHCLEGWVFAQVSHRLSRNLSLGIQMYTYKPGKEHIAQNYKFYILAFCFVAYSLSLRYILNIFLCLVEVQAEPYVPILPLTLLGFFVSILLGGFSIVSRPSVLSEPASATFAIFVTIFSIHTTSKAYQESIQLAASSSSTFQLLPMSVSQLLDVTLPRAFYWGCAVLTLMELYTRISDVYEELEAKHSQTHTAAAATAAAAAAVDAASSKKEKAAKHKKDDKVDDDDSDNKSSASSSTPSTVVEGIDAWFNSPTFLTTLFFCYLAYVIYAHVWSWIQPYLTSYFVLDVDRWSISPLHNTFIHTNLLASGHQVFNFVSHVKAMPYLQAPALLSSAYFLWEQALSTWSYVSNTIYSTTTTTAAAAASTASTSNIFQLFFSYLQAFALFATSTHFLIWKSLLFALTAVTWHAWQLILEVSAPDAPW